MESDTAVFIYSGGSGTIPPGWTLHKLDRRHAYVERMPTAAEECLNLAKEATQIYARQALLELAAEFRQVAKELERRSPHSTGAKRRRAHNNFAPPRRRRAC
jgi:hypothetical protein